MDERRATHLGAGYGLLSEAELQVVPIIAKCLEGMKVAAAAVDSKNVGAWSWASGLQGGQEDSRTGRLVAPHGPPPPSPHRAFSPGLPGPDRAAQVRLRPPGRCGI